MNRNRLSLLWILASLTLACGGGDRAATVTADRPRTLLAAAPAPAPEAVTVAAVGAGDTARYSIRYVLNKALRPGDSVRVNFRRDSTGGVPVFNQSRFRFFQRDSAQFTVNKIYGKVAKYVPCVRVQHGAWVGPSKCAPFQTELADTTPPVVDTVTVDSSLAVAAIIVKPDSTDITAAEYAAKGIYPDSVTGKYAVDAQGKPLGFSCPQAFDRCPQRQFCALVKFRDGKVAMRVSNPCPTEYAQFPASVRAITAVQQSVADRRCVAWTLPDGGGSITAGDCGASS